MGSSPFRETQQNNYAYDLIILHQLITFAICLAVNVWLHILLIESKWMPVVHGFRWSALQVPYRHSTGMRKEPAHGPASWDRETNSIFKLINWWVWEIMWWILVDKCCHRVDLMWHYRRYTRKPVKSLSDWTFPKIGMYGRSLSSISNNLNRLITPRIGVVKSNLSYSS